MFLTGFTSLSQGVSQERKNCILYELGNKAGGTGALSAPQWVQWAKPLKKCY